MGLDGGEGVGVGEEGTRELVKVFSRTRRGEKVDNGLKKEEEWDYKLESREWVEEDVGGGGQNHSDAVSSPCSPPTTSKRRISHWSSWKIYLRSSIRRKTSILQQ